MNGDSAGRVIGTNITGNSIQNGDSTAGNIRLIDALFSTISGNSIDSVIGGGTNFGIRINGSTLTAVTGNCIDIFGGIGTAIEDSSGFDCAVLGNNVDGNLLLGIDIDQNGYVGANRIDSSFTTPITLGTGSAGSTGTATNDVT